MGLTVGEVVERLAGVEPFDCAAVGLFRRIQGGESAMDLYPEMEEAIRELDGMTGRVKGMVMRCYGLRARPARVVPQGF